MPSPQPGVLTAILFSRDRPIELGATLASLRATCADRHRVRARAVVYASHDDAAAAYAAVAREHPWAELVAEDGLEQTVARLASDADAILFVPEEARFAEAWSAAGVLAGLEGGSPAAASMAAGCFARRARDVVALLGGPGAARAHGGGAGAARAVAPPRAAPESDVEREEFEHLAPLLSRFAGGERRAIDVGANVGGVALFLARLGYRVLALEPNPEIAAVARRRLDAEGLGARTAVLELAASDAEGHAELLVGSEHTVASLDPAWTEVAFPELFRARRAVRVPARPLRSVAREHGFSGAALVKIDVEGHEPAVLRGLLGGAAPDELPAVVMFEANQRFPEHARRCLAALAEAGYDTFDAFIKEGPVLRASCRFTSPELPPEWRELDRPGAYFYANILAYHPRRIGLADLPPAPGRAGPRGAGAASAGSPHERARSVLARAQAIELERPFPVHRAWEVAREELRALVSGGPLDLFLRQPVCRHMFVRTGFGAPQAFELDAIRGRADGARLLELARDPAVGGPEADTPVPGVSANALGMAYYLHRLLAWLPGGIPPVVVELGGGYGALARLACLARPDVAYVVVDLPETLAVQHFFLEQALPARPLVLADQGPISPRAGEVTLVPASRAAEIAGAELLVSTFAFSELPAAGQALVVGARYFGARHLFLAGQLATERPTLEWVRHADVIGPIVQAFPRVSIERFHLGDNYLLLAERPDGALA